MFRGGYCRDRRDPVRSTVILPDKTGGRSTGRQSHRRPGAKRLQPDAVLRWSPVRRFHAGLQDSLRRTRKKRARGNSQIIETRGQLADLAKRLADQPAIAFDTEFLWERTYSPALGLIQVADTSGSWAVDPLELSSRSMRPLLDIFVSPGTLKIAHAVDQDQICLHRTYGIIAEPVLDTSTAAALLGIGDQVGLSKLLRKLLGVRIGKGYSRTNWLKRPIPEAMLKYALEDVSHLPQAATVLREKLDKLGRMDWALELSARSGGQAKAQFDPKVLARKIAGNRRLDRPTFGVLRELVAWREERAEASDIPRKWIAEDRILVKLATARPATASALRDFRGLGGTKSDAGRKKLLFAIQRGLRSQSEDYTVATPKRQVTQQESATLAVLRCFLGAMAATNSIPLRLLIDSDRMVELIRGQFADIESLRASGVLKERAVDLIGEDLVAILSGRKSLSIRDGRAVLLGD